MIRSCRHICQLFTKFCQILFTFVYIYLNISK